MKILRVSLQVAEPDQTVQMLFNEIREDMFGVLIRNPIAEIPDLDSHAKHFHIHIPATRHLGDVTTSLKKLIKRHGLIDRVKIERLD